MFKMGDSTLALKDLCLEAGLLDLDFVGCRFTWSINRAGNKRVSARLDRVYVNGDWISKYSSARVHHLLKLASDHRPIMLDINENCKPFRSKKKLFSSFIG
ncbi:hypothetical protein Cni_G24890 [Canna indica]|uniref:Uncharacterized protein n=1 Tax=Canna indica TaxID=4628 RepID=A0AAQ3QNN4_9LILI|nr:hypothetical protein Cni_G24890 [Canna indica]